LHRIYTRLILRVPFLSPAFKPDLQIVDSDADEWPYHCEPDEQ
jgi:hypothetical protein